MQQMSRLFKCYTKPDDDQGIEEVAIGEDGRDKDIGTVTIPVFSLVATLLFQ